ncbi:hypothetical protein Dimus_007172 [Dionaea muscipula]
MADDEVTVNGGDDTSSDLSDWTDKKPSDGEFHVGHLRSKIEALENESLDLVREKHEAEKMMLVLKALLNDKLVVIMEKEEVKKKLVESEVEIEGLMDEKGGIDELKKAEVERSDEERRAQLELEVARVQQGLSTAEEASRQSGGGSEGRGRVAEGREGAVGGRSKPFDGFGEGEGGIDRRGEEFGGEVHQLMGKVPAMQTPLTDRGFGVLKVRLPVVGAASGPGWFWWQCWVLPPA